MDRSQWEEEELRKPLRLKRLVKRLASLGGEAGKRKSILGKLQIHCKAQAFSLTKTEVIGYFVSHCYGLGIQSSMS